MTPYLVLILALFAFQGGNCGFLDEVKEKLEAELEEVVRPLVDGMDDMRYTVEMLKAGLDEHKEKVGIDLDACANLSLSLLDAEQLGVSISETVFDVVKNTTTALNNILSCTNWNPVKTVSCVIDNLHIVKDEIESAKPLFKQFKQQIEDMYIVVHAEFLQCIGFENPFRK